jgi:hypothetical protein
MIPLIPNVGIVVRFEAQKFDVFAFLIHEPDKFPGYKLNTLIVIRYNLGSGLIGNGGVDILTLQIGIVSIIVGLGFIAQFSGLGSRKVPFGLEVGIGPSGGNNIDQLLCPSLLGSALLSLHRQRSKKCLPATVPKPIGFSFS